MTIIRLPPPLLTPVLSEPVELLERLYLFPGGHLGEDEFDRLQAYADARLAPLLAASRPGILRGLQVDLPTGAALDCTVRPGLAVSADGRVLALHQPTQATWAELVDRYLLETETTGTQAGVGLYYLVLRRSVALVDADQGIDPCRRTEQDPRRDTRLMTLGTLALRRPDLTGVDQPGLTPVQVQNRIAGRRAGGAFLAELHDAVPLGLLAIGWGALAQGDGYRLDWFSQPAGRYLAIADSGHHALLAHTQAVFQNALAAALSGPARPTPATLAADLEASLRLDYLPAAGVLPTFLLERPHARLPDRPRLRWLPAHLAVDMVPVPEESVADLIERHLGCGVIELTQVRGDHIRLLLAVNEPDYRPDLLDIPQVDAVLISDLWRYYMRAHDAWRAWRTTFDRLYAVDEGALPGEELAALRLPTPYPAPVFPGADDGVFTAMLIQAQALVTRDEALPYPYSEAAALGSRRPDLYDAWLDPQTGTIPAPPPPADNGLVIRYRVRQLRMQEVDAAIRIDRSRLDKTRDFMLLQRQQLDSQTVSLASLAGGVAGDGSGLQVARWLPFANLKRLTVPPPAATSSAVEAAVPATPRAFDPLTARASSVAAMDASLAMQSAAVPMSAFDLRSTVLFNEVATPVVTRQESAVKGIPTGSILASARFSTAELGLQRSALDRLSGAAKQTVTNPAIAGETRRFGVIDQIRPEVPEYRRAYQGMLNLLNSLPAQFGVDEGAELNTLLTAADIGTPIPPDRVNPRTATPAADDPAVIAWGAAWDEVKDLDPVGRLYHALFHAGQILARQIAAMEGRYGGIEDRLETLLRERVQIEDLLDQLTAEIELAGQALRGEDGVRVERLGDYGVAQALVRDDWSRVYRTDQERTRILTHGLKGLYYVRVRQTPISAALADPLELRHGVSGDQVPGCDWTSEVDVPEALRVFFEAVLEVPMADWALLKPLSVRLPPPARLDEWWGLRRYRFGQRRAGLAVGSALLARGKLADRLAPVIAQTQAVYQLWGALPLPDPVGSLNRYHAQTAQVLALQDLLAGGFGDLKREAQTLHNRLEQCTVCLLTQLNRVQPSLRLDWAQRAEDDRLDVTRAETWPGLERAEAQDFNAVRTIAELTAWWFRQLDGDASANGRAAMRAMLRAALIYSALGDPTEILRGTVVVPPRRFVIGEPLRLVLNRSAAPGTRLQILDDAQRLIGILRVDDHDEQGALARVERVDDTASPISTGFTVVANQATTAWAAAQPAREVPTAAQARRVVAETWKRDGRF